MKRKILFVLLAVFLLTFVVSAVMLIHVFLEYSKADELYTDLQKEFVEPEVVPPLVEEGEPPTKETASTPITVNFEKLQKKNSEAVGWIYCEDTVINYPVVQAKDNKKYLHADLDGKYLRSGTVFVDYRNGAIGEDRNYLIYGHDMRNNSMFGSLSEYKKQRYFDAHPVMYYLTPHGNYRIELAIGAVVDTDDLIYQTNPDKESFATYLAGLKKKSTFRSEVELTPEDKVVTLSTCSYEFDNARYIVIGKLVPLE